MSVDWILLQVLGHEAAIAARAVAEATEVAESVQHESRIGVLSKSDASPATVADFAVQALLADRLASAFPDLPLVAEEDASDLFGECHGGRSSNSGSAAGHERSLAFQLSCHRTLPR